MKRSEIIREASEKFAKRRKHLHAFAYGSASGSERLLYYLDSKKEQLHNTYSVTKTITSIAVGVALKECNVSVYTPLKDIFKYLKFENHAQGAITIENLLQMSAGYEWDEKELFRKSIQRIPWSEKENMLEWAIKRPLSSIPGNHYNYDSLNSHILSGVVSQLTGKELKCYCKTHIFEPLGIDHMAWDSDFEGHSFGGHGLYLSLQGMLKIGEALNNKSLMKNWLGEEYYKGFQESAFKVPFGPYGYGYHTWTGRLNHMEYFAAFGHGGQRIICLASGEVLVTLGQIWPEFGTLEPFLEKWLSGERDDR